MLIDKPGLARLIPHSGTMCLLDSVQHWDKARIICTTATHQALNNPLRREDRVGVLCGVEYAAQAMALHGALSADSGRSRAGFLASVRAVAAHTDRLDTWPGTLLVEAEHVHGDANQAIYRFIVRHEDHDLLTGRAAVVLS